MNPYSGLVELFEKKGLLKQTGNRLKYVDSKGKEIVEFRKNWTGDKLDIVMAEFHDVANKKPVDEKEIEEDGVDE
jgi:hypothetical protein